MELGDYRIPAGTITLWSPWIAGRDPQVWPDALLFDPDRFRDPTEEQRTLARTGWVPLGGGARGTIAGHAAGSIGQASLATPIRSGDSAGLRAPLQ